MRFPKYRSDERNKARAEAHVVESLLDISSCWFPQPAARVRAELWPTSAGSPVSKDILEISVGLGGGRKHRPVLKNVGMAECLRVGAKSGP